ncbi:MAG: HlyD family efflux transporter periplasmic adaptor subunit [Chloroflexota bacterium]|nr:HlyD family efflux transporter periplasmic adaptor subunit [Chloroflexota bacterium]MDE2841693.1 HlyD family efflux transporter periplasmic adaptor subunit [Chloroflexota bacterium]MDE2930826.1 HlyD family efflux transporter periplasmic adaptor subunit [Chloroflexota bacterium]
MKNNRRLFREEAFARRGKTEPLNGLLRVTAPHEWILLVCLGLGVLGLVAWGLWGSVEQSVSARCVFAQPGDRFAVVADFSGTVVDLLVEVGDEVEAGQPIARLRSPELRREIAIARSRVAILEGKDAATSAALDVARSELTALEARESAGEFLTTPYGGIITVYDLSLGQSVAVGTTVANVRVADRDELEAVAVVLPESAMRLAVGMEAHILALGHDGRDTEALQAEVTSISTQAVTPPHWLTAFGLSAMPRGHVVGLVLLQGPPSVLADGDPCQLRIVVRKASPARLLLSSGSN